MDNDKNYVFTVTVFDRLQPDAEKTCCEDYYIYI